MIEIKIYKKLSAEDFFSDFTDAESKLDTGSLNAMTAACACSLFERAANSIEGESERVQWLKRNAGILRTYMVHMIDDDVKARAGLVKERKEGDRTRIEAAIHPACTINEEIINMLHQMLELNLEYCPMVSTENLHYLKEAAHLALGCIRSCISWLLDTVSACSDETYRFVVKRENEMTLESCEELCRKISQF